MRNVIRRLRHHQPSGTVVRIVSMLHLGSAQCQDCGFVVKMGPGASALMDVHEIQKHGRSA